MMEEAPPTIEQIGTQSETEPDIHSQAGADAIFESSLLNARSQSTIYAPVDETGIDLGDFEGAVDAHAFRPTT